MIERTLSSQFCTRTPTRSPSSYSYDALACLHCPYHLRLHLHLRHLLSFFSSTHSLRVARVALRANLVPQAEFLCEAKA